MSGDQRKPLSRPRAVRIPLSDELLCTLEALPSNGRESRRFPWTPELDKALLAFWPVKRQVDVARALGCCHNTARQRYRELTGGKGKEARSA